MLRRADGRTNVPALATAAGGFVLWATILLITGHLTGMSAAEYIPTAVIEGLVLAGLFLAASLPVDGPLPGTDRRTRRAEPEGPYQPGGFDPNVWLPLFSEPGRPSVLPDEDRREAALPSGR